MNNQPWWVCDKNLNVNSQLTWVESYDTGCEAQGILPPRLLLAECTSDLCQSFNVCTEGDLGGLRQGVMTPHKLHNSLKTHTSFSSQQSL